MPTTLKTKSLSSRSKALEDSNTSHGRMLGSKAYCTLCTRTVDATVSVGTNSIGKKYLRVTPGQKCPRCSGPLDAAYVLSNLS